MTPGHSVSLLPQTRATCRALMSWQGSRTLHDILGEAGPDGRSHDDGQAVTGHQTARRHVLRVEEFLPYPKERVWRALTDPDLIARWLMPNDFEPVELVSTFSSAIQPGATMLTVMFSGPSSMASERERPTIAPLPAM